LYWYFFLKKNSWIWALYFKTEITPTKGPDNSPTFYNMNKIESSILSVNWSSIKFPTTSVALRIITKGSLVVGTPSNLRV
jgi:hypothetical protein